MGGPPDGYVGELAATPVVGQLPNGEHREGVLLELRIAGDETGQVHRYTFTAAGTLQLIGAAMVALQTGWPPPLKVA